MKKRPFDFLIFLTVLVLLGLGTIMVFSAGSPHAYTYLNGDTYYFLKKQIVYVSLGLIGMFVTMNVDYRKLGKMSPIFLGVSILLLSLVCIPGVGISLNGARRWLGAGGLTIQPSEFAKISVILFFSYSISKRQNELKKFKTGLMPYLMILGVIAGLLLLEPHLSGTIIIGAVAFIILFVGGAKILHFILLGLPVIAGLVVLVLTSEYRLKRLISFMDPWKDIQGAGWQIVQSLYAIGGGGLFGRGLGKSLQKFLYIPEPYNDFIFAVYAEELGFVGVLVVLALFTIFLWRGVKIATHAPDLFGSLLAMGITCWIMIQMIINILVVTSSMPVTGMPLPFFSYGGTSLIFLLSGIGILLNISRYSNYERI